MIEAVVFDLDGTLLDLRIEYEWLFKEVAQIMTRENVRPLLTTIAEASDEQKREIFERWNRLELAALPKATAIAEGMTEYGKFSQKPRALVTMQGRALAKAVLERFGLSFSVTITREDSIDRINQLQTAIQELDVSSEKLLFIGNEDHDEKAAKEVGCRFRRIGKRKSGMTHLQENI